MEIPGQYFGRIGIPNVTGNLISESHYQGTAPERILLYYSIPYNGIKALLAAFNYETSAGCKSEDLPKLGEPNKLFSSRRRVKYQIVTNAADHFDVIRRDYAHVFQTL
jgi:hypothetical protein